MTPSLLLRCTCLLIACHVQRTLSVGKLQFYRDGVPETLKDIALRDFARYLEGQSYQHRRLQRAHLSSLLSPQPGQPNEQPGEPRKKHHLEIGRQKPRDVLLTLNQKPSIADMLRMAKAWRSYHRPMQYNDPVNVAPPEREYGLPYYDLNPVGGNFEYSSMKLPYLTHEGGGPFKETSRNTAFKDRGEEPEYRREAGPEKELPFVDYEKGMKEVAMLSSNVHYGGPDRPVDSPEESGRTLEGPSDDRATFTFRFDDANVEEEPFAVKPNDPRYYRDGPFSLGNGDKVHSEKELRNDTKWEGTKSPLENEFVTRIYEESADNLKDLQETDDSMVTLPEPERRSGENHPLAVPINRDLNNDIYFIAIVAGCSAAAMFALVLISLTWCRLQRGVKAAADIEYPAYGVTGPNKDVSPSGDQRLAQSAQMYHFQHQKQQIIAMENRTSATRDPGSVSEAESDEENEEGDYTVYECPGLAPTGEMEVQNPLFHDEPTPATPAQTSKEEDHI